MIVALGLSWPFLAAAVWAPIDVRVGASGFALEAFLLTTGYVVGVPVAAALSLARP